VDSIETGLDEAEDEPPRKLSIEQELHAARTLMRLTWAKRAAKARAGAIRAIFLLLAVALAAGGSHAAASPGETYSLFLPHVQRYASLDAPLPRTERAYLPLFQVMRGLRPPVPWLSALYYDTLTPGEADEAIQLWNPGPEPLGLTGYSLDDGPHRVTFPASASSSPFNLPPSTATWCAYSAVAFQAAFGYLPGCEYGPPTGAGVLHLDGPPLRLSNAGGRVTVFNAVGVPLDTVVYKAGAATYGWEGPGVQPWHPTGVAEEGQVVYRKLDETTLRPLANTRRASDWATDPTDPLIGRKVRYPAWDVTAYRPLRAASAASVTVAVAPDAAFDLLRDTLRGATRSLHVAAYTFSHPALADALAERAAAGVQVTVLLEGAPSGGLQDEDRWAAMRVAQAGGTVLYMSNAAGGKPRYRSLHAKYVVVDGTRLLLATENLSPESLPNDRKADGTLGRRGVALVTEQRDLVAHVEALFARDSDPRWRDLVRWNPLDTVFGPPTPGYVPVRENGGIDYPVQAPMPVTAMADQFELLQSPENSLRASDGLIGLVAWAGQGDSVLVETLDEPPWWGGPASSADADPNPRLAAYLAAARRGATVRLLLDSFFDSVGEPRANRATCVYVNNLAVVEGLDLQCRTGNPTGLGIHNKLALVRVGGEGYVHMGSLNGTEISHKLNRELALQFHSPAVYDLLARVWAWDWAARQ